jgi:hypothetical protein
MDFPYGVTVTVERPAGFDQYGNPLAPATHTVAGCAPAPAGSVSASVEDTDRGHEVEWDLDLLAPYGADVVATDVVLIPGDPTRYQVHGRPRAYRSPFTGWESGAVVRLKGVEG